jgi:Leucine-rich repeat (LRR) protein
MGFPEDAIQISLVGKNFDQVIEEDLLFFSNVMYLDVSENQLNFYHFYLLQSLKELRIACNNITKITFPPPKNTKVNINFNIFESLMILDISYNHLNLSSIEAIADYAPYLKELDLCGNELMEIPTKMWKYGSLEKLNMSHNRLDDPQIFIWLGQMPKLRFLSLSYNLLSAAPEALKSSDKFFRYVNSFSEWLFI